jgi:cytochrome c oxidase assembly protein subunit 11
MAWTAGIVAAAVLGMTALAFSAPLLYSTFCRLTGYGGTTQTATRAPSRVLDRQITVRFDANVAPGLPVEFTPEQNAKTLKIGETGLAFFRVRNTSNHPVEAIASYNVAPHQMGQFFVKLECFCFKQQVLQPGESSELPVVFFVDPGLVNDIDTSDLDTVTLSYTFFASADQAAAALE